MHRFSISRGCPLPWVLPPCPSCCLGVDGHGVGDADKGSRANGHHLAWQVQLYHRHDTRASNPSLYTHADSFVSRTGYKDLACYVGHGLSLSSVGGGDSLPLTYLYRETAGNVYKNRRNNIVLFACSAQQCCVHLLFTLCSPAGARMRTKREHIVNTNKDDLIANNVRLGLDPAIAWRYGIYNETQSRKPDMTRSNKKARIPAATRALVTARHTCCVACGTWDASDMGHLIAESRGGSIESDNLVLMCHSCNTKQADANVVFGAFASYTETPALIISRRAYWARYCSAARGTAKLKPYKPA